MLRWTSLFSDRLFASRLAKGVRRKRRRESTLARRLRVETLEDRRMLAVITVTGTGDTIANDGLVTLREAITAANTNAASGDAGAGDAGLDTIEFNIAGAGPHTISPTSLLPTIIEPIFIDGFSQTGAVANTANIGSPINAVMQIEIDGSGVVGGNGLEITAGGSTVRGLVINRFDDDGIDLRTEGGNTIVGNYIGTDVSGEVDLGNGDDGIYVLSIGNNTIGGNTAASRNLISGNDGDGVRFDGDVVGGNMLLGNFIGTDKDGDTDLGNSDDGVNIDSSVSVTVGGITTAARNLISGNNQSGVRIVGATATGNSVLGNFIGTDLTGTVDLGNSAHGVNISGAPSNTIGGTVSGSRNVISGNNSAGVQITGNDATGNMVLGNFIGTDLTGMADVGNSGDGIFVNEAPNNTIGGTSVSARNVVSGNGLTGVEIDGNAATGNTILGNYIGTDVTGAAGLGNDRRGVLIDEAPGNTIGGATAAARNVISSNGFAGVEILGNDSDNNNVLGNYIGTDFTGTVDLGNSLDGVLIDDGDNNTIGGTAAGAGNTIAFNEDGVDVRGNAADGNRIQRNSIFNNDDIGIDLIGGGPTPNDGDDPDAGPNQVQNFPVFVGGATLLGNSIAFRYRVPTSIANATYPLTIEFFVADSDNQEGQAFLASDTYTAAEAGTTKVVVVPAPPVLTNIAFVATATDAAGNTSEFSAPVQITLPIILGSEPTLIRPDEFININQVNRYQYIAHSTGKTVVRIDFLHLLGDLDLEVRDEDGNLLALGNTSSADQNFEEVLLPMVGQERYFINVIAVDFDDDIGQSYALEVENFPAPVPTGVHLDPASDSGRSNTDNLTNDTTPTFFIQTDVFNFVDTNSDGFYSDPDFIGPPLQPRDAIHALTAAEAQAILDGTPEADDQDGGIAVQLTLVNTTDGTVTTGFADPVVAILPEVYRFTTTDPLTPGVYFVTARTKVFDGQGDENGNPDQAMGRSDASPPLWFTIDTLKPNVFFGDAAVAGDGLDPTSDSGVASDATTLVDRITNDTTPSFFGTSEANATVRVYVLNAAGARVLIGETVATPFNGNNPLTTGRWTLTSTINMNDPLLGFAALDGLRQFELEAEDIAGNLSQGVGFELAGVPQNITDDTAENDFIITVSNFDGSITDLDVGLDIAHTFDADLDVFLISPAGTIVELFTDVGGAGNNFTNTVLDDEAATAISAGAVPFTGAFQPEGLLSDFDGENPNGNWTLRIIDDAGGDVGTLNNWSLLFQSNLEVFFDTQGPTVTNIFVTDDPAHNLFDPKPSIDGPTPLVNQLSIAFSDLPNRVANFTYDALVEAIAINPGNFQLIGDQVGNVVIQSIAVTATSVAIGFPAASTLTLTFAQPLADDRYTLTISDNLVDPAGNHLDGESQFASPGGGFFPSGDGIPGGDFVARFNVDTRPEIGVWAAGTVLIDTNGNFLFDPENPDPANRDIVYHLGFSADNIFAGNFPNSGNLIVGDDAVFIIDVSGSTSGAFGGDPVGDLNSDGNFDSILDAEIAAFKALNQELIDRGLGNISQVAIVSFSNTALSLDMDPLAPGIPTTPLADTNTNGMRDVDEVLMALLAGGSTNYEAALSAASTAVTAIASPNTNVIFLSDGEPNTNGAHADETATLLGQSVNLRAFGVGPAVPLAELQIIDPAAVTFSNTNELLNAFGGGGGAVGTTADGFDKLAAYGRVGSQWRWMIDTDNDGVPNIVIDEPLNIDGIPVAGNFDGNLANGDEVGVFDGTTWYFDTNGDFQLDAASALPANFTGFPIVGDFDGNGVDDLGTYSAVSNLYDGNIFSIDLNRTGVADFVFRVGYPGGGAAGGFNGFPGVRERPVAADMNADGFDDIGLWVPDGSALNPGNQGEWFFFLSGNGNTVLDRINNGFIPFTPTPFGNDIYARFGNSFALPIVGNFDPPVVAAAGFNPVATTTVTSTETQPTPIATPTTTTNAIPPESNDLPVEIESTIEVAEVDQTPLQTETIELLELEVDVNSPLEILPADVPANDEPTNPDVESKEIVETFEETVILPNETLEQNSTSETVLQEEEKIPVVETVKSFRTNSTFRRRRVRRQLPQTPVVAAPPEKIEVANVVEETLESTPILPPEPKVVVEEAVDTQLESTTDSSSREDNPGVTISSNTDQVAPQEVTLASRTPSVRKVFRRRRSIRKTVSTILTTTPIVVPLIETTPVEIPEIKSTPIIIPPAPQTTDRATNIPVFAQTTESSAAKTKTDESPTASESSAPQVESAPVDSTQAEPLQVDLSTIQIVAPVQSFQHFEQTATQDSRQEPSRDEVKSTDAVFSEASETDFQRDVPSFTAALSHAEQTTASVSTMQDEVFSTLAEDSEPVQFRRLFRRLRG